MWTAYFTTEIRRNRTTFSFPDSNSFSHKLDGTSVSHKSPFFRWSREPKWWQHHYVFYPVQWYDAQICPTNRTLTRKLDIFAQLLISTEWRVGDKIDIKPACLAPSAPLPIHFNKKFAKEVLNFKFLNKLHCHFSLVERSGTKIKNVESDWPRCNLFSMCIPFKILALTLKFTGWFKILNKNAFQ